MQVHYYTLSTHSEEFCCFLFTLENKVKVDVVQPAHLIIPALIKAFSQCTVRLVGWSNDSFQGRVEVYVNGTWGGVCGYHNYWDLKDANVVCRQLGFKGAIAAVTSSDFPQNNLIPNLQCKGNETSLTKCEHVVAPKGKYCSYNRDACVVCITGTTNNYYGAALNGVKVAISRIQC